MSQGRASAVAAALSPIIRSIYRRQATSCYRPITRDKRLMKLAGKVALVTGASAGIGQATALALAKEGADVAINYLTFPEGAEKLAGEVRALGRRALLLQVDVSDQAAVEAMVGRAVTELGRLDIVVTNAVYSDRELFHIADMKGFRRTIDVTMWGAFYTLRAAANALIRQAQGGSIVVVSSGQS